MSDVGDGKLTSRSEKFINSRGMSIKHAAKIGEYNKTNSRLMVFRPINPGVAKKLDEDYKGKVIFIKSKSSEFPPIAGDIPFEAELSKSFDKGRDVIDHFNQVANVAVKNIRGNTKEEQEKNAEYKKNLEDKIKDTKEELEGKKQELETIKQKLIAAKDIEQKLETKKQELTTTTKDMEQKLETIKQKLEEEIKKDEEKLKYAIDEYNLNFFLYIKPKEVKIPQENGKFRLYYRETTENGHNVEVNENKPVFYVRKTDGKYYKITGYNNDGSIESLVEIGVNSDEKNIFQEVKIFTYSQYKMNKNGEILEDTPPLTADYDQLTAGSVYMTINTNQTYEKKKKLWKAINDITGLQNSEFNQENLKQIKNHFKNIQIFLPIIERGKKDNYNCIRNVDSLTIEQIKPNEIKEQLEYLKDGFLTPAENIDLDVIDLKFCKSEREKLITYPADKYMEGLRKNIENILNIKDTQKFKENCKDNLAKIEKFLPDEFKKKYLPSGDITTLGLDSIDMEEIKTQLRIINKKLGLLGTCSEDITREKMAIGEILEYAISHGLEIQHFPPEDIKPREEEFLIIDEMGKVRVIDGLEGLLSHINYKKSRGIACLEVNPLWPIKKLDNGDIVYSKEEQTPIAEIYDALVGLQLQQNTKKDKTSTEEQEDKFDPLGHYIYAERLYYNGDFIPCAYELKQKDVKKFEELKSKVTIDALTKANMAYQKSFEQLEIMLNSPYLKDDFLDFCSREPIKGLASYLENHEDLLKWLSSNKKIIEIFHQTWNSFEGLYGEGTFEGGNVSMHIRNILDQSELKNSKDKEVLEKLLTLGFKTNPRDPKIDKVLDEVLPNLKLLKGLEEGRQFKIKISNTKEFIKGRVEQIQCLLPKKSQSLPPQESYHWRDKVKRSKSTPNLSKTGHILG